MLAISKLAKRSVLSQFPGNAFEDYCTSSRAYGGHVLLVEKRRGCVGCLDKINSVKFIPSILGLVNLKYTGIMVAC